jgi:hypothetical protein
MVIGFVGLVTAGAVFAYPDGYAKPLILAIEFARPRDRHALMADPAWHDYRGHLLSFLEERAHHRGKTVEFARSAAPLLSLSRQAVRWINEKSDVKCGLAPHDLPRMTCPAGSDNLRIVER